MKIIFSFSLDEAIRFRLFSALTGVMNNCLLALENVLCKVTIKKTHKRDGLRLSYLSGHPSFREVRLKIGRARI